MEINFFSEDIDFRLENEATITQWIRQIISDHSYTLESLTYIFCSDEYLLAVNKEHLNHDYYTDIITFDNSEESNTIESDIFISIDRVKENAQTETSDFLTELHRVMIHGVLHLLGFNDKDESQQKAMREKEDACLSLLPI